MNLLDPVTQDPSFRWNEKTARHLLNRAGFGVPPSAIKKLTALTPEAAVASFVDYQNLPDVGPPPPQLPERLSYKEIRKQIESNDERKLRELRNERRRVEKQAMVDLQTWWITRMCKSQRPLQEKMSLFWHGHFATSAEKVKDPQDNFDLNEVFRKHGMGNFTELTRAVGKSPAMLRYLDQQQSSRQHPNENWARELMELFTLGIGHYSEKDIKEAARAFTGWVNRDGEFAFALARHDFGLKTILGATAAFDGDAVVNLLTSQPACAQFICTKLWHYFAYDDPEPEVIAGLAQTMRSHNMEIKPVLRQMFLSQAFYQEKAYFSQVKSPAQLVVSSMVQLGAADELDIAHLAVFAMRAMGQSLFYPPNVKGWDGGRAWINTNTLLVRYNFTNFLVSGVVPDLKGSGNVGNIRRQFLMAAIGKKNSDSMAAPGAMMAGDGDQMMAGPAHKEDENDAPAGQDAMPKDIPAQTFYNKLRERRQKLKETAGMTKEERREQMMLEAAMKIAPFEARDFFMSFKGQSADQIVTALSGFFIGFSLDPNQTQKLETIMGQAVPAGTPVPVEKMSEEDLRATVQLMLSTVEYQVC